jgi:hypothetical protein
MTDQRTFLGMTFAELAGNAGFICATAAYLNTDVLMLRGLAMSGMTLNIIFHYYRATPGLIPVRWNIWLLAINAAMVSKLLLDHHRANSMPPELEELYREAHFEKRGVSRVEFCKLFGMGKEVRYKTGDLLTRRGQKNFKL